MMNLFQSEITEFETEQKWRERLKAILELDYGHTVYEEVSWRNSDDKGRLDLYVITRDGWPDHRTFPVIGIECKNLAQQGMGWLISARDQMRRYINPRNVYMRHGERLDPPSICLVATPESWHDGVVYRWNGFLPLSKQHADLPCWETMTFIFNRLLMKDGCAILLDKRFQSNAEGGAVKNYYLGL